MKTNGRFITKLLKTAFSDTKKQLSFFLYTEILWYMSEEAGMHFERIKKEKRIERIWQQKKYD